jgi:hypothetical protein
MAPMKRMRDNPFLLAFFGLAMPNVIYVIWGVLEWVARG